VNYLITGGTGSFGRAFATRLLADKNTKRVAILSRNEHAQAEMATQYADPRLRFFIGDVRDRDRLRRAFDGVGVVIHAAALKRIEVGHYNPTEMVQTNVLGAMNVIEAAIDAGVERVVALSTDKAFQPVSPYGHSKALAEGLFRNAYQGKTKFAVTRYGNVWNSAGSVVPKWREILKSSDTVPVTDPDATRFFMWMSEATKLVSDTIETMTGGELVIPTLPAYRLGDLAGAMGAKIKVVGMPEWEKKHEGMSPGHASNIARRMSVAELREALRADGMHRPGQDGEQAAPWENVIRAQWANGCRRSLDPMSFYIGS
jgi:UDP-N-acetylglucosamine 4,6-dehydratase